MWQSRAVLAATHEHSGKPTQVPTLEALIHRHVSVCSQLTAVWNGCHEPTCLLLCWYILPTHIKKNLYLMGTYQKLLCPTRGISSAHQMSHFAPSNVP